MSDAAMAPGDKRYQVELTEFDLDILGRTAVQLRIPIQDLQDTLNTLRKLRLVTERAIVMLEAAPTSGKEDRSTLFQVRSLFRGLAMSIAKVKRRRY